MFPTAPMCSTQTVQPTAPRSHLLASPTSLSCFQQPVCSRCTLPSVPRVPAAWSGKPVPSAQDSTTLRESLGDARNWLAWGLREPAPPTRTRPCDLTLSWVETNFPRSSEKERDRAEQSGQPLGHPHGCTLGGGDPDREAAGTADSPRSAALLHALAVLRGVSAASRAHRTVDWPASFRRRSPLPAPLPHRALLAWFSQARAPRSRATLGSARCRTQREPSQSSGARGAAESPPPRPGRTNQREARRQGLPRSPRPAQPRGRAHRDLPGCCRCC